MRDLGLIAAMCECGGRTQNSVTVPGNETRQLAKLAARLKVTLVIGVNEKVESGPGNGTLFNSLLMFGADGKLANHHRK